MAKPDTYIGVDNDVNGGMTTIGKLVRDARVFGIIDDSETCVGWNFSRVDDLLDKVNREWDKYGCMVSHLPKELFNRHQGIHTQAIEDARAAGWCGEQETEDEN